MKLKYPNNYYPDGEELRAECIEEERDISYSIDEYKKLQEVMQFFLSKPLSELSIIGGSEVLNDYIRNEVTKGRSRLFKLDWIPLALRTNGKLSNDEELFISKYLSIRNADSLSSTAKFISKENWSKIFDNSTRKFPIYYPDWIFSSASEDIYLNNIAKIKSKKNFGGAIVKNPKVLSNQKKDQERYIYFNRLDYSEDFIKYLISKRIPLRSISCFLAQDPSLVKKYFKDLLKLVSIRFFPNISKTEKRRNKVLLSARILKKELDALRELVLNLGYSYYQVKERITYKYILELWELIEKEFGKKRKKDKVLDQIISDSYLVLSSIYTNLLYKDKGKDKLLNNLKKIIPFLTKTNSKLASIDEVNKLFYTDSKKLTKRRIKYNYELLELIIKYKLVNLDYFAEIIPSPEYANITNPLEYLKERNVYISLERLNLSWITTGKEELSEKDFNELEEYFSLYPDDDDPSTYNPRELLLHTIILYGNRSKKSIPVLSKDVFNENFVEIKREMRSMDISDTTGYLVKSEYDLNEEEIELLYDNISKIVKEELFKNNDIQSETLKLRWEMTKMCDASGIDDSIKESYDGGYIDGI